MGLIKEPEGVDFVIQSKPLTQEEELALSKLIREYKEKNKKARQRAKTLKGKVIPAKRKAKTVKSEVLPK